MYYEICEYCRNLRKMTKLGSVCGGCHGASKFEIRHDKSYCDVCVHRFEGETEEVFHGKAHRVRTFGDVCKKCKNEDQFVLVDPSMKIIFKEG